jgi:hypothetical protein
MTHILIRAELTGEALNPRFAVVMIDGIRTAIPRSLVVTPDDPVTPAMVEAWAVAPVAPVLFNPGMTDDADRICAQTDWSAMLTALLKDPPK